MSAKQVVKAIKRYSKFLITSHVNLEGDAIGSELALASLLRKLGKTAYVVNHDKTIANYNFLPGAKRIYSVACAKEDLEHRLGSIQAVFIIDCPNKERTGAVKRLIDKDKPIINIDHHIGNSNFGQINWVNPKVSSTGEMIYQLFALMQTKLDKADALNIYTAILTDTGSFRHSNTTSATHLIAGKLIKLGIKPAKIYTMIYESNSVREMALVAKIISKISFAAGNKIAWVEINKSIFRKIKDKHGILDKVLDFAKSINTVKVIIVFSQQQHSLIKLSLRSKPPIDVQKIALYFGGGGHRLASGCTIKAGLKQAEKTVLRKVKAAV